MNSNRSPVTGELLTSWDFSTFHFTSVFLFLCFIVFWIPRTKSLFFEAIEKLLHQTYFFLQSFPNLAPGFLRLFRNPAHSSMLSWKLGWKVADLSTLCAICDASCSMGSCCKGLRRYPPCVMYRWKKINCYHVSLLSYTDQAVEIINYKITELLCACLWRFRFPSFLRNVLWSNKGSQHLGGG